MVFTVFCEAFSLGSVVVISGEVWARVFPNDEFIGFCDDSKVGCDSEKIYFFEYSQFDNSLE